MGKAKTKDCSLRGALWLSDWRLAVEIGISYRFWSNAESICAVSWARLGNNLRRTDKTPYSCNDDQAHVQDHVVSLVTSSALLSLGM